MLGGGRNQTYFICMTAWGMGDRNIGDITQRVHEGIPSEAKVLTLENRLRFGEPLPDGRLHVGVYLDDLLLVHRALFAQVARGSVPSAKEIERVEQGYAKAGLQRSPGKGFRNQIEFKAWGAEVRGRAVSVISLLSSLTESS